MRISFALSVSCFYYLQRFSGTVLNFQLFLPMVDLCNYKEFLVSVLLSSSYSPQDDCFKLGFQIDTSWFV